MKRILLSSVLLFLLFLASGLTWLVYSPSGFRVFLSSLSRAASIKISVGAIEGNLASTLAIRDLVIEVPQTSVSVSVHSLELSLHLLRLLDGALAVDRLSLRGVTVSDNGPASEPFTFVWPRLPRLSEAVRGSIQSLRAEEIRYVRLGEVVFSLKRLGASLSWRYGVLGLQGLSVEGPDFSGKGTIDASFFRPSLVSDLSLNLQPSSSGIARLAIKTDLGGKGAERTTLAGTLSVKGSLATGEQANLEALINLFSDRIGIETFRLVYTGIRGAATGAGSLTFGPDKPRLHIVGRFKNVRQRVGKSGVIVVTGEIKAEGMPDGYQGAFDVAGRLEGQKAAPWRSARAAGMVSGDLKKCTFTISSGAWLGGSFTGKGAVDWHTQETAEASLRVRGLNPALLSQTWTGVINANAGLRLVAAESGLDGNLTLSFPESTLRGKRLTGELAATLRSGLLQLSRLELRGDGFDIRGSGALEDRLYFDAVVTDMGGLIPETSGSAMADGWLRWKEGRPSGVIAGKVSRITIGDVKVEKARFSGRLAEVKEERVDLDTEAEGVTYGRLRVDRLSLMGDGRREDHTIRGAIFSGARDIHFVLKGSQDDDTWKGAVASLQGSDRNGKWSLLSPAELFVTPNRVEVSSLHVASQRGESLTLKGDVSFGPSRGFLDLSWGSIDLARIESILRTDGSPAPVGRRAPSRATTMGSGRSVFPVRGTTTGRLSIFWPQGSGRTIEGQATVSGRYNQESLDLPLTGAMRVTWRERGLTASWEITLPSQGRLSGRVSATGPPAFQIPERATVDAEWEAVNIALFRSWLPRNLTLQGQLSGRVRGAILQGNAVDLTGTAAIDQGSAGWRRDGGELLAAIEKGTGQFVWSGTSLRGDVFLSLKKYGKLEGTFSVPLPARMPPKPTPDGPLALSLKGQFQEQGLITALLPAAVQETRGTFNLDAAAGGTWRHPIFTGGMTLQEASVSLPMAGIKIERLQGRATLADKGVRFLIRAESGGGWVEAAGDVRMGQGQEFLYEGALKGAGFQALNRPDVRAFVAPHVTFHGDNKLFVARGNIDVPRMSIFGESSDAVVKTSPDVVVVDSPAKTKKASPVALDIQIRIVLGEKVTIQGQGVEARLAGAIDMNISGVDKITARGRVTLVDGGYKAYGIRLTITRGNIDFAGPIDSPRLDILATRKTEDVVAGVQVRGTAKSPIIDLYSSPPMSEGDKLSYIILGHPLATAGAGESGAISGAAGIFEGGATPTMTSEARRRLGLTGPPGTTPQEEAARSMVSIGHYLTPSFYVGIGRSLVTNENLFTLRYNLSKKWEVESRLGGQTGMDLFYRIEFD